MPKNRWAVSEARTMGGNPAMQQALQQALSEALGTLERQLGEAQSSLEKAKRALDRDGSPNAAEQVTGLLPPLMQVQAAGAALAASVETVLRFLGVSAQWTGATAAPPVVATTQAAPATEEAAAAPAIVPETVEEVAAPVAEEEVAPAAEEAPAEEVAVSAVGEEEEKEEKIEETVAAPVDVTSLPDELQQVHKKAARFARVTVQEFFMYKSDEVTRGRENKDLYQRFKDEIDRSKELYDQRFEQIAPHNIDYLYDELVRVLAENDPGALGDYPYPTPSSH
jgi:hypothetical protein